MNYRTFYVFCAVITALVETSISKYIQPNECRIPNSPMESITLLPGSTQRLGHKERFMTEGSQMQVTCVKTISGADVLNFVLNNFNSLKRKNFVLKCMRTKWFYKMSNRWHVFDNQYVNGFRCFK